MTSVGMQPTPGTPVLDIHSGRISTSLARQRW